MLMNAVHDAGIFDRHEQEIINRYCCYKGVNSIGDIVCSDGVTIDPVMLTKETGQSSIKFPHQFPTRPDHKLWLKVTKSLTQTGHKLWRPLGRNISVPHMPDIWFMRKNLSSLFLKVDTGGHDVYTMNPTPHATRYGTTYTYSHHNVHLCPDVQWASITNWLGHTVQLHSLAPAWLQRYVHSPNRLLAMLASWENQSLWTHLWIDGGVGDWVFSGLIQGLLVIWHDGSYMPHLANNVCAAVIYCSHTDQYTDVTWGGKSTKKAANNCCVGMLGGCSTQLIIKAAIAGRNVISHCKPKVGCDNMGVVRHGNSPRHPMLVKQPQSDVVRVKGLMASSQIGGWLQHVYGHADDFSVGG